MRARYRKNKISERAPDMRADVYICVCNLKCLLVILMARAPPRRRTDEIPMHQHFWIMLSGSQCDAVRWWRCRGGGARVLFEMCAVSRGVDYAPLITSVYLYAML